MRKEDLEVGYMVETYGGVFYIVMETKDNKNMR